LLYVSLISSALTDEETHSAKATAAQQQKQKANNVRLISFLLELLDYEVGFFRFAHLQGKTVAVTTLLAAASAWLRPGQCIKGVAW
jgi:hypothetical protein